MTTEITEVTETYAKSHFWQLLDRVEQDGDTFAIVRDGRRVARIGPANDGSAHVPTTDLSDSQDSA